MLQRFDPNRGVPPYENGELPHNIDLVEIYTFLKRNRRIIAGWAIVALTLALVSSFTATPLYTSMTDLTIDSRKVQLFKNDSVVGDSSLDSGQIDSELEVLRSETIAFAVIRDQRLTADPEFVDTRPGPVMRLISMVFGINEDGRALSDAERERIAVNNFRGKLTVKRIGLTYVIEISFRSVDPGKAARIANAVADAYIGDQLDTKYQATRRASIWLQERIAELRNQSNLAARAVQDYKEKNNIVDTGGRGLLSDLQLQEFNSQMISAAAQSAEAKARLERIQEVLQSPTPGEAVGTVTDTLHNEIITRLRNRYLDDRQRVSEWTPRMGPNHIAVINMRNEMKEMNRSIADELQRIAESYQSDYNIAKAREQSIRESLEKLIVEAGASGQAQVDLRELQASAQTYHTIFESFLQKYTEAVQQQSFPISDARVITFASTGFKTYPKTTLVAMLGLLVGTAGGIVHAIVLHHFDRAVRKARDIEERLGIECLGLVPLIPGSRKAKARPALLEAANVPAPLEMATLLPSSSDPANDAQPALLRKVVEDPLSHFTEGLRSAKTSLDIMALTRPMQTIGLISAIPGEGKSTIAVNLAQLFAGSGRHTLLVDADMRNPALSRQLAGSSKNGLLELIRGEASLPEASIAISEANLQFLPVLVEHRIANASDLLGSDRMKAVLTEARQQFHQVIVDLPPLGPVVDARAISPQIDAFILVVEWGRTRFDMLEDAVGNFGVAADKIAGVILNKVNYRELRDLYAYSHGYYFNKYYARYGYAPSPD